MCAPAHFPVNRIIQGIVPATIWDDGLLFVRGYPMPLLEALYRGVGKILNSGGDELSSDGLGERSRQKSSRCARGAEDNSTNLDTALEERAIKG